MSKIIYHLVQHDGGWAYRVDETFSETFPTYDSARQAAERAAREAHQANATLQQESERPADGNAGPPPPSTPRSDLDAYPPAPPTATPAPLETQPNPH